MGYSFFRLAKDLKSVRKRLLINDIWKTAVGVGNADKVGQDMMKLRSYVDGCFTYC
jgi:hypothetical protein